MQEKEIIISSLSHKTITPKPGASWKAFNVYQILANDGNTYETTDQSFYQSLQMGQTIKIKFEVQTKTSGGRVYTSYKIASDKPNSTSAGMQRILDRLDKMETNILAALKPTVDYGEKPRLSEVDDFADADEIPF